MVTRIARYTNIRLQGLKKFKKNYVIDGFIEVFKNQIRNNRGC